MATVYPQMLYLSNVFGNASEVINGARTARRLIGAQKCGDGSFSDVLDNAGCDALMLQPCTMDTDGSVVSWQMGDFKPEAAPWYTGSQPSLDAFGFYIEEWTGLDGAHHGRSITGVGANQGGAYFGPQSHSHRTMKLNVLLVGASEAGLTHLFHWLEDTLLRCCVGCGDVSMWVREYCPPDPVASPEDGLARLTRVVLLEGPTWEAPVTERSGASIRRASFTLAAGDPCLYKSPSNCAGEVTLTAVAQAFTGNTEVAYDGSFNALNAAHNCTPYVALGEANYGVWAPKVTISSAIKFDGTSGLREALPDIRISGYANPGLTGFGPSGSMRKFGELIISGRGTSGLEIVADLAERTVKYREVTGSTFNGWIDGSRLIGRPVETSLRRWWSIRTCDYGVVNVEPVYKSLYNRTEADVAGQLVFNVTIDVLGRWGCC